MGTDELWRFEPWLFHLRGLSRDQGCGKVRHPNADVDDGRLEKQRDLLRYFFAAQNILDRVGKGSPAGLVEHEIVFHAGQFRKRDVSFDVTTELFFLPGRFDVHWPLFEKPNLLEHLNVGHFGTHGNFRPG